MCVGRRSIVTSIQQIAAGRRDPVFVGTIIGPGGRRETKNFLSVRNCIQVSNKMENQRTAGYR